MKWPLKSFKMEESNPRLLSYVLLSLPHDRYPLSLKIWAFGLIIIGAIIIRSNYCWSGVFAPVQRGSFCFPVQHVSNPPNRSNCFSCVSFLLGFGFRLNHQSLQDLGGPVFSSLKRCRVEPATRHSSWDGSSSSFSAFDEIWWDDQRRQEGQLRLDRGYRRIQLHHVDVSLLDLF